MKRNDFCRALALAPLAAIHGLVADESPPAGAEADPAGNEESLSEEIDLARLIWGNWNLGNAEGYSALKFILRERGQAEKVAETRSALVKNPSGDLIMIRFRRYGKSGYPGISVEPVPKRLSDEAKKIVSFMPELYRFEGASDDFTVSVHPFYFRISLLDVQRGDKEIVIGRNDEGLSDDLVLWLERLREFCNETK